MATWPALRDARSSFLAERHAAAVREGVAPGDHLQTAASLWLVGHQLERGEAPWLDPYAFQPVARERLNFAGWPFGLVWWPLHRLLGVVGAWNAFVLLGYALAGGAAAVWLRSLGLGRWAAAAGGLAFALAPYRAGQEAMGHLLAWTAALLPLALWAWERRRAWLAAAALASIPLSGQLHLALAAVPLFAAYALVRGGRRERRPDAVLPPLAAVAAGLLVWAVSVRGSLGEARSFAQVERYSADASDLLSRSPEGNLETFVFVGWLTPLLALAGLAALASARRAGLAALLALAVVLPAALALGANLPGYRTLWELLPGLGSTRVPARLFPVACLALAALAAAALDRVPRRALAAAALVALALDLRLGVELYGAAPSDERNAAYTALHAAPPGRLLELPVFLPDRDEGSVYGYYAMQAPRERPSGYATTARRGADGALRELRRRACGSSAGGLARELRRLGVRYVTVHRALAGLPAARESCPRRGERLLRAAGYREVERDGGVTLLEAP